MNPTQKINLPSIQQIILPPNLVLKQVSQDQVSCMCLVTPLDFYVRLGLVPEERSDLFQTTLNKRVCVDRANVNS